MPNFAPVPALKNLKPGAHPTGRQTFRQSASLTPADHRALLAYLDAHAPATGAGGAGRKRSQLFGEIIAAGMEALKLR